MAGNRLRRQAITTMMDFPDLAVSANGGVALYHNEGDGTFKDVTDAAGIHGDGLALGVTFIDYDHDGDLDLYVTRFSDFPLEVPGRPFSFPAGTPRAGQHPLAQQRKRHFHGLDEGAGAGRKRAFGGRNRKRREQRSGRSISSCPAGRKLPSFSSISTKERFAQASPWAAEMPGPTAGIAGARLR